MHRKILVKRAFARAYERLGEDEKRSVDEALRGFERYLESGAAPAGLGIKHLGSRTYEFRVGLRLRAIYVLMEEFVLLSHLGTHDEARRFLKRQ